MSQPGSQSAVSGAVAVSVETVDRDGFEALAGEWEALALRAEAPIFSRPGWVRAWWAAFGQGELRLFACRREGELTGVLPLFRRGGRLHSCSNVHTPAFEAVALEGTDLEALLAAALEQAGAGLLLTQLDSDGPTAAAARRLVGAGGCRLLVLGRPLPSSRVAATLSWEEFEAGLKSKRRSDVRRQRRRLGEIGAVSFETAATAGELSSRFPDFLQLEGSAWKLRTGTAIRQAPETERFYAEMSDWAAQAGVLRLSFMRVGERAVSTMLSLEDERRRFGLKTGYDEELAGYSPGLLHHLEDVHRALEAGHDLELGTGEEPLKRELRNATWEVEALGLFPRTARGALSRWGTAARRRARAGVSESELARKARDAVRRNRAQR